MTQQPDSDDHADTQGTCDQCGRTCYRYRGQGDISCDCGAEYNCGGQRLRDNWRDNPSNYDDDIGDLEGYELSELRRETW